MRHPLEPVEARRDALWAVGAALALHLALATALLLGVRAPTPPVTLQSFQVVILPEAEAPPEVAQTEPAPPEPVAEPEPAPEEPVAEAEPAREELVAEAEPAPPQPIVAPEPPPEPALEPESAPVVNTTRAAPAPQRRKLAPPRKQVKLVAAPPKQPAPTPPSQSVATPPRAASASTTEAVAAPPRFTPPVGHAGYLDNPPPQYPVLARRRGLQGRVLLRVDVGRTGEVRSVRVKQGSGHAVLDRAARATVLGWRFRPATRNGAAVVAQVDVPIRFVLQ
ncbi:putative TonB family protein [Magnetofaba australis IT-1]|uniref:Protein TonB n=2 Tax=Magnetofaba TaxID=1472292 RepID=A0A1Y2K8N0_9PROT|nr:putative TonB family protein [Magnetofaba australis IT-1]